MTDKRENPLRLEPPVVRSDAALGERLAELARSSLPTPVRRRAAWRAPLAGLAIVVGTGGLAFGAETVAHHIDAPPVVVPTDEASPTADASAEQSPASTRPPGTTPGRAASGSPSAGATPGGRGLKVGKGHAKGPQNAPGHAGTAPGQQRAKQHPGPRGNSSSAPGKGLVHQGGAHAQKTKSASSTAPHPSKGSTGHGQGG